VAPVSVLVPSVVLGGGFAESALRAGVDRRPDAIAVDGGSTDSGPYYLGAGVSKMTREATARDLRLLMQARAELGVPLIVGSCGTSGTDGGVRWMKAICEEIARDLGQWPRIATIFTEPDRDHLERLRAAGRFEALRPELPLTADLLRDCSHIVSVIGAEPINAALD
jgi:hypothetical protein